MAGHPYVTKLTDGRYFIVELPEVSAESDPKTGELILNAPALRLLDRVRTLLSPMPAKMTPGRLRTFREALGKTPDEMAALLAIAGSEWASWEAGDAKPQPDQLAELEQLRQRTARGGVVLPDPVAAS